MKKTFAMKMRNTVFFKSGVIIYAFLLSPFANAANYALSINDAKKLEEHYIVKKMYDSAFYYQSIYYQLKDSALSKSENTVEVLQSRIEVAKKQSEINLLNAREQKNKIMMYALIGITMMITLVVIAINKRYKDRSRTENILERTNAELKESMKHLREAEIQLVNSEKMSSLGRLSASIAHELRNPLNFITNFSDTSSELTDEILNANTEEERKQCEKELAVNVEKITEHSMRAGKIIENMLQHDKPSLLNIKPTNINDLCNECIDLAVNGLKASGKSFNGTIKKIFGDDLPLIFINKEDIASVLVNLLNNALFAVQNKFGPEYLPVIEVTTKKELNRIYVSVSDNGTGIPENTLAKIFEPFFTTKGVNEGTGLGLSICYDIVKKHNGNITVVSESDKGSTFKFYIPIEIK